MLSLTCCAVAELAVKRCLSTQLILDSSAMTASFVDVFEVIIIVVDSVWSSLLPLFDAVLVLRRLFAFMLFLDRFVGRHLGGTGGGAFHEVLLCCQSKVWCFRGGTGRCDNGSGSCEELV